MNTSQGARLSHLSDTGKVLRQVEVVEVKAADLIRVRALNGPIRGMEYDVHPDALA